VQPEARVEYPATSYGNSPDLSVHFYPRQTTSGALAIDTIVSIIVELMRADQSCSHIGHQGTKPRCPPGVTGVIPGARGPWSEQRGSTRRGRHHRRKWIAGPLSPTSAGHSSQEARPVSRHKDSLNEQDRSWQNDNSSERHARRGRIDHNRQRRGPECPHTCRVDMAAPCIVPRRGHVPASGWRDVDLPVDAVPALARTRGRRARHDASSTSPPCIRRRASLPPVRSGIPTTSRTSSCGSRRSSASLRSSWACPFMRTPSWARCGSLSFWSGTRSFVEA
jgi:hypothetical protein